MPSQSLPDGVTRWRNYGPDGLRPHPDGALMYVSDLPKIEEQAEKRGVEKERERLLSPAVLEAVAKRRHPLWARLSVPTWWGVLREISDDLEAASAALDQEDDRG